VNTDKTEFFTAEFAEKNFSGFTIIVFLCGAAGTSTRVAMPPAFSAVKRFPKPVFIGVNLWLQEFFPLCPLWF
jgi:hypothetical protein